MATQGFKLPIISANEPVTAILSPCLGTILIANKVTHVPINFHVGVVPICRSIDGRNQSIWSQEALMPSHMLNYRRGGPRSEPK